MIKNKEQIVVEFYRVCNKLKTLIRTGWKDWHVSSERLESVAEHVYSTQMLALAMYSQYEYDFDITKLALMLAIHEIGETVIGDITLYDEISKEEKAIIERKAVLEILKDLNIKDMILSLFDEFEEKKTPIAKFAYQCDKLECDLQSKVYDEQGVVDIYNQDDKYYYTNERVQRLLKKEKTFSNMWLASGQELYPYDENFMKVSTFVKENGITKNGKNKI